MFFAAPGLLSARQMLVSWVWTRMDGRPREILCERLARSFPFWCNVKVSLDHL
jgi:hypothetical protein